MRMFLLPIKLAVAAAAITSIGGVWAAKSTPSPTALEEKRHRSSLTAKLTLLNGKSRAVALEGVGCTASMCSRVFVNSRERSDGIVTRTWLDSIAAIKEVTVNDALFVFRDGTERRLSVVPLNRILYIRSQAGGDEKIDLAKVRSLEFVAPSSK